jgi:hypothetical protein
MYVYMYVCIHTYVCLYARGETSSWDAAGVSHSVYTHFNLSWHQQVYDKKEKIMLHSSDIRMNVETSGHSHKSRDFTLFLYTILRTSATGMNLATLLKDSKVNRTAAIITSACRASATGAYMYTCIHVCVCMYACNIYVRVCTDGCNDFCMRCFCDMCVHACMYSCVYVCMSIITCAWRASASGVYTLSHHRRLVTCPNPAMLPTIHSMWPAIHAMWSVIHAMLLAIHATCLAVHALWPTLQTMWPSVEATWSKIWTMPRDRKFEWCH